MEMEEHAGKNNVSMRNEIVSVIIPCYKQAGFLKESINSVLAQTYPQFEIVVIDDGSPDNVLEVIKLYPQVRLVQQPNQGAAVARNKGIRESKGTYIVFLDADDRLLPNALEEGINFLAENPAYAYVTGQVRIIDAKGNVIETPSQPVIEKDHYKTLLRSNYIWTPGVVMYRKSIFDLHKGFDPLAGGSADYELNLRIARSLPVGCHGKVILEYRQHDENMSSNLAYMLRSGVSVRRAEYKYVKHDPNLLNEWKTGIRIIQQDVGEQLLRRRNMALKDLWYILKYYPWGVLRFFKMKLKEMIKNG